VIAVVLGGHVLMNIPSTEMCEGKTRGRLISSEVLFTAVGIVVAYWFDFGMSFVGGPIAWRLPIAMQMIFAIFVIVLVFGLPESPRWLMNHGQEQEAMDVLSAVYDRETDDEFIVNERKGIMSAIELEDAVSKQSFWKIFRNDEVKTGQRVLLAWGIQLMNQVGGINLVVYFVPSTHEAYAP
jgi:MFS family permease